MPLRDLRNNLNNFVDRLDRPPNAALLVGNKHFQTSNCQVHRRANWTNSDECVNGENTGRGVLNLFRGDIQDYVYVYPLLDRQPLNGVIVEHDIPLKICTDIPPSLIKLPSVGGVSDGLYGLAVRDTATHNLTAKRS